jgi:hypothetical protein
MQFTWGESGDVENYSSVAACSFKGGLLFIGRLVQPGSRILHDNAGRSGCHRLGR